MTYQKIPGEVNPSLCEQGQPPYSDKGQTPRHFLPTSKKIHTRLCCSTISVLLQPGMGEQWTKCAHDRNKGTNQSLPTRAQNVQKKAQTSRLRTQKKRKKKLNLHFIASFPIFSLWYHEQSEDALNDGSIGISSFFWRFEKASNYSTSSRGIS